MRIFLCDPICAPGYGHLGRALLGLKGSFEGRGFTTFAIGAKQFARDDNSYSKIDRHFTYLYEDLLPVDLHSPILTRRYYNGIKRRVLELLNFAIKDPSISIASHDFSSLFSKYSITSKDQIILPNVDYYSALGLMSHLRALNIQNRPKVHFRFIGVMENASTWTTDPLAKIMRERAQLTNEGTKIEASAESPIYASELANRFGIDVSWTIYPRTRTLLPRNTQLPLIVFAAGTARADKGYDRILPISRLYKKLFPEDAVLFRAQRLLARHEIKHATMTKHLEDAQNLTMLAAVLTDKELEQEYGYASILLLPYDQAIYRLRGTGVFMDGIERGRHIVMTAKTGFQTLALEMPSVKECVSDEDFCNEIRKIYLLSDEDRQIDITRSSEIYDIFSERSFSNLLGIHSH